MLVVMGSGARDREARPSPRSSNAASGSAWCRCGCTGRFPPRALLDALPATVRTVAVLDRTKEPGSIGEPLFLDVVAALAEAYADGARAVMPRVSGGRYGLSSKEFTPAMVAGVFAELAARAAAAPVHRRHRRRRLRVPASTTTRRSTSSRPRRCARSSSGWVRTERSARTRTRSRSSGPRRACTPRRYFVYDSKKSGSQTVSHLRFGPHPIRAPYLVTGANFVGCHQFRLLDKVDVLGRAAAGATLLLNCRLSPDKVWDALPRPVQEQILAKRITLYTVDADRIAREVGLAGPDQHRAADLLLRDLGRAAARAGDRPDQGVGRQDLRQPRRRGAGQGTGRGRRRGGRAAPGRGARPRSTSDARTGAARCPTTRRSSSAPSPRR